MQASIFLISTFLWVAAVVSNCFAVTDTSKIAVIGWGKNEYGQLGNGTVAPQTILGSPIATLVNTEGVLAGKIITAISCGGSNTLALSSDGLVFSWGWNQVGELGSGQPTGRESGSAVPVMVKMTGTMAGKKIVAIATGSFGSIALSSDNKIYQWGGGQIEPFAVRMDGFLQGKNIISIGAGGEHYLALSSDGLVFTWGSNALGQLGNPAIVTYSPYPVPVDVSGVLAGVKIKAIAGGATYSLALSTDGKLFSWGDNSYGQLGTGILGNNFNYYSPVPVVVKMSGVMSGKTIKTISTGSQHCLAISTDGLIFSWGSNNGGCLGAGYLNGNADRTAEPVSVIMNGVMNGASIIFVSGGSSSSLALASDGRVFGWGDGNNGQLAIGNGSTAFPIASNISNIIALPAHGGGSHCAALTEVQIITAPTITTQPSSSSVTSGSAASFSVAASGTATLAYQWRKDGTAISGATSSTYSISSTSASDAGSYTVVVTNSAGSATSNAATLTVTAAVVAPTITTQPSSSSVISGSAASFSVAASGTATLTYQWRKDGTAISGATSSTYSISSTATSDAGSYTVVVTNSAGSATSNAATLTVTAAATAPRLSNLSVRTALGANQIVIVGVTMSGGAKNVLLRAAGPTLSAFGVPSVMADPKLELYSGSIKVTTSDNWGGSSVLSSAFQSVGAFAYSSTASLDAALVTSIDGGRTVQVSGPTAGTVLVEGYDAGSGDTQRFTNLSARNKVGTGANILIAGFTLTGSGTRNLLIRAVGPKLSDFGVTGVLIDPKLEIYSGSTKLTENDNWSSSLATTFSSVGAFGLTTGSKDAAITVSLPAGGYTVQVSGADGGVGEAIVEIYELP
jgi:alpha-tubulin suppressor-like RCC1 family protein